MCRKKLTGARLDLVALAVAGGLVAGPASAQVANNCPNYANTSNGAYCINGSDTWFDVMTQAIKNKVAEDKAAGCATSGPNCIAPHILQPAGDPAPGESLLYYNGTGSGNAANSMKFGAPAAGGALPLNGGNPGLGTQSIGAMSRNFRPNESCKSAGQGGCSSQIQGQFPSWQPGIPNVGGLDAATIITRNQANRFTNFDLPLLATDSTKANPNTSSLAATCNFGTPGGPSTPGVAGSGNCYDQLLQLILSGFDGSGSTAACAHPARVQAIADFSSAFGSTIRHFYRRDENSGTTDTFKDKINVGRFCSGTAVGVLGANKVHPNLNNEDHDPIRRPCDVSQTGVREAVNCTDLSTGLQCNTSAASCTQGFLTALSENDPGISDITVTIATRVGNDLSGLTVGYAGREGIRLGAATTSGPFINTNPPTDALVRGDVYLLSRRLYLMRGPAQPNLDTAALGTNRTQVRANTAGGVCPDGTNGCLERVNNLGGSNSALKCPDGSANSCTGGGAKQVSAEDAFFRWATDAGGGGSQQGAPGRFNLDPVMTQFGFLPCTSDSSNPTDPNNLCVKTVFPTIPSPPSACIPTSSTGPTSWTFAAVACSGTQVCCSNGLACSAAPNTGTQCAAATGRPVNTACSAGGGQAECASGLTCTDIGGGLLACQ
jgi:hypothetical protein